MSYDVIFFCKMKIVTCENGTMSANVTWVEGQGLKSTKKSVTYYLNCPLLSAFAWNTKTWIFLTQKAIKKLSQKSVNIFAHILCNLIIIVGPFTFTCNDLVSCAERVVSLGHLVVSRLVQVFEAGKAETSWAGANY